MKSIKVYETFDKLLFRDKKEAQQYEKEVFTKTNKFIDDMLIQNGSGGFLNYFYDSTNESNYISELIGIDIKAQNGRYRYYCHTNSIYAAIYICAIHKVYTWKKLEYFNVWRPPYADPKSIIVISKSDLQWIRRICRIKEWSYDKIRSLV